MKIFNFYTMLKKLSKIQQELKAPKNQRNTFANYNYRSCEDILEAVKPLLGELVLTISDEICDVGGRVYVKATAKISDGEKEIEVTAYARESLDRKGMDDAQITGATSSYARKYALNGLFLIDDTKDSDYTNTHGTQKSTPTTTPTISAPTQLGKCVKCGADNMLSKAGKVYCGSKCWL